MRHAVYFALCAIALQAPSVSAQGSCAGAGARSPAYCFAADVIDALYSAHVAALSTPDTAGVGPNTVALGTEMLYVSSRQRAGLSTALRTLAPYRRSRDSLIQQAARDLSAGLSSLYAVSLGGDSALRDVLDNRGGSVGTQAQRIADLRTRRHAAATVVLLATIATTYSLLEPNPSDPAHQRLDFRAEERTLLLATIQSRFAGSVEPPSPGGQYSTDYAAAVHLLRQFLEGEWPTRP